MELTKFEKDMAIIQALDDEPNDVGGLTSAELKAKFDEGGEAIKTYINETLLPETQKLVASYSSEGNRILSTPTLYADKWELQTGGYYTQTVEAEGVKALSPIVHVGVNKPGNNIEAENAAEQAFNEGTAESRDPAQMDGGLTFFFTVKPEVDIQLKVGVV